jgi:hypothetical protein
VTRPGQRQPSLVVGAAAIGSLLLHVALALVGRFSTPPSGAVAPSVRPVTLFVSLDGSLPVKSPDGAPRSTTPSLVASPSHPPPSSHGPRPISLFATPRTALVQDASLPQSDASEAVAPADHPPQHHPSLDDLGVTKPLALSTVAGWPSPDRRHATQAPSTHGSAETRIQRSLRQGLTDRDESTGLHFSGSILGALRSATQTHFLHTEGSAIIRAVVDSQGTATLGLAETSDDAREWTVILAEASRQIPAIASPNVRNTETLVRVRVQLRLPSGANPRSLPHRLGRAAQVALSVLGQADPADIAGSATRSVEVSVLRTRVIG